MFISLGGTRALFVERDLPLATPRFLWWNYSDGEWFSVIGWWSFIYTPANWRLQPETTYEPSEQRSEGLSAPH